MNLDMSEQELTSLLFNVARALAILVVGIVVARMIRGWIVRLGARNRIAVNIATLLGNLAQVGVVILAVVLILPIFGVDWTGLIAVVGAASLAISLAFQDLLRNFIAGIYLLIEQPFRIGDIIAIGADERVVGTVQSIALRTTSLRTPDGLQVIVPNNTIMSDIVTNRSAINLRRHVVSIAMAPDEASLSNMSSHITDALHTVPGVAPHPAPTTRVDNLSAQSVKLHVEFWSPPATGEHVLNAALLALRAALPTAEVAVVS